MKNLIAISFVGLILVTLGDASELKQEASAAKLLQDNIYAEIRVLLEESIKENTQKEKLITEVAQ